MRIYAVPVHQTVNLYYTPGLPNKEKYNVATKFIDRCFLWVSEFGEKTLKRYGEANPNTFFGTIKVKIHQTANSILDSVAAEETLMKALSFYKLPVIKLEVRHPSDQSPELLYLELQRIAATRASKHMNGFKISILTLPLSLAAGLLPLPNIFMAWNLFRLYSNRVAYLGATHLMSLTTPDFDKNTQVQFVVDEKLDSSIDKDATLHGKSFTAEIIQKLEVDHKEDSEELKTFILKGVPK